MKARMYAAIMHTVHTLAARAATVTPADKPPT